MKQTLSLLVFLVLLLAACQPGPAAEAPEEPTEALPGTGVTETAPGAVAETPAVAQPATQAVTETPAATGAPAGTVEVVPEDVGCELTEGEENALIDTGAEIYSTTCAGCHGPEGEGVGDFPALAGNALLNSADPTQAIEEYLNPDVHPFLSNFTDEQSAAALSYVRNAFGNQAPVVCQELIESEAAAQ